MRKALLSILFIILPLLAHSQETIVSYDKSSLAVLNEELRQSSSGLKTLRGQVADLLPIDLADSTKITNALGIANGGTGQTTAQTAIDSLLPSQTGNSGKALVTNGTNASWGSSGNLSLISTTTWSNATTSGAISFTPATKNYLVIYKAYNPFNGYFSANTGQLYINFTGGTFTEPYSFTTGFYSVEVSSITANNWADNSLPFTINDSGFGAGAQLTGKIFFGKGMSHPTLTEVVYFEHDGGSQCLGASWSTRHTMYKGNGYAGSNSAITAFTITTEYATAGTVWLYEIIK